MPSIEKKSDSELIKISLVMTVAMVAPALNSTIVNVAINTISEVFKSSIALTQWITTVYILVMGIAVPLSGWFSNKFSLRKVHLISQLIFLMGSVAAALSWNIESLIAFRVIQAAGAGIMLPIMQNLLVRYTKGAGLGRIMAIVGIVAVVIPVFGPVAGGLIINNLSWQWIFYINIPICLAAFILTFIYLPYDAPVNKNQKLDIAGLLLLSSAFILFLLAISKLRQGEIPVLFIAAGIVFTASYIAYALKSKIENVLNIRLFQFKNFTASSVLIFISGAVTTGTLFILPLFFQQAYALSPLYAGWLLASQGIGMLLTRTMSGKLTDKIGARFVVFFGLTITALGTLPFALFDFSGNIAVSVIVLLARGAGLGFLTIPAMVSIYDGLSKKHVPHATIAARIFQQIGAAFGTAVLAIILQHHLSFGNVLRAFRVVFAYSAFFAAACGIPAFFLKQKSGSRDNILSGDGGIVH